MIRTSQAFAAFRQAVIEELQNEIQNNLIPSFNAEVVDIDKLYKSTVAAAEEASAPNARECLLRVAMRNRDARFLDLKLRRQNFLDSIQSKLRTEVLSKVDEYKGERFEEVEERNGKKRKVEKVKFPDGSVAKVPGHVFIEFQQFYTV